MAETVILCGGTSGMGLLAARELASRGALVVATGRDLSRFTQADRDAGIRPTRLDLGSLGGVRTFADSLTDLPDPDVVILNAGQQSTGPRSWTTDGFEATVGVNFLAPLALLDALLPRLRPGARVIWTASGTHNPDEVRFAGTLERATLDELLHPTDDPTRGDGFRRYATSKLCVVRAVPELARRLAARGIRVNAFDPGLMPGTGLARDFPPALRRAWSVLTPALLLAPGAHRAATSARHLTELALGGRFARMTGAYVVDTRPAGASIASFDAEASAALYARAREVIGAVHLPA